MRVSGWNQFLPVNIKAQWLSLPNNKKISRKSGKRNHWIKSKLNPNTIHTLDEYTLALRRQDPRWLSDGCLVASRSCDHLRGRPPCEWKPWTWCWGWPCRLLRRSHGAWQGRPCSHPKRDWGQKFKAVTQGNSWKLTIQEKLDIDGKIFSWKTWIICWKII